MDIFERIHQINQGFPESFSSYPKPPVFSSIDAKNHDSVKISYSDQKEAALYIHIPFCAKKCSFCFIDVSTRENGSSIHDYIDILINEMESLGNFVNTEHISGVYIGGGTPTMLSTDDLTRLILCIKKIFPINQNTVWEIDATPITITRSMLDCLLTLGVDNFNIGIQSTEKKVLSNIGREWQTYSNLQKVGALTREYNISVHLDFIIGLPGEHISTFRDQLDALYEMFHPKSLSINIYEETLYSPDFFNERKHIYPHYANLSKLAGILEQYLFRRYGLGREQTPYINEFRRKRKSVFAFGAGAFGYVRGYGMYKNAALSEYMKPGYDHGERYWVTMSLQDEKLMFLMHNYSFLSLEELYYKEFGTFLKGDFPELTTNNFPNNIRHGQDGIYLYFEDHAQMQRFFIPFYSQNILEIYEKIVSKPLSSISDTFNAFYGNQ